MIKDLLIVAQYTQAPGEFENDRFRYLAEHIRQRYPQVNVEVVTMSYSHHKKAQRQITEEMFRNWKYKMTFIPVPAYRKNVSLARLRNTRQMGIGLEQYLNRRAKPDVIYCAVPSLDAGYFAAKYALENHIPFYVDVQDLWPEAFQLAFHIPLVSDLLFAPMRKKADYIYQAADQVIAVSQTYLDRAMKVNTKCKAPQVVYLGTDLSDSDPLIQKGITARDKARQEVRVAYVGTLGNSYDITCVIDALAILHEKSQSSFHLLVMGDGPLLGRFREQAQSAGISAEFTGRLPYVDMIRRLASCDIAVNPIQAGAAQSIINKHADYAAAGLPVINTQECPEYRSLLENYQAGFNCQPGNAQEISEKLELLAEEPELRDRMGKNSRRMADENFDRGNTYQRIVQLLISEQEHRA